ncbi:MAG: bifunctional enoyl-CoA hydratase/phosphate acetyltransferase [Atribacterota bacterium]|nr:bifunctional enoyl-CoA hydratase/phosphate acetyltransferase [Atribacterota bacterium]
MLKTYDEIVERACQLGPKTIAVAKPDSIDVMFALEQARQKGMINSILVGDKEKIINIGRKLNIDLLKYEVIDTANDSDAANTAVKLVREKQAELLMKGMLGTAQILKAVLSKEIGLRTKRLLSHAYTLSLKKYNKLLTITDAAMNIAPTLEQKAQIMQNVIEICQSLEIKQPKIAALAAVEMVNPNMQATIDAACLSKMAQRGQITGAIVDGPLAFDNAVSRKAAMHKGINSSISGEIDAVLVPDIESGNILAKSLVYLADAEPAGVLLGTASPVILVSRSDTALAKVRSIALGILMTIY